MSGNPKFSMRLFITDAQCLLAVILLVINLFSISLTWSLNILFSKENGLPRILSQSFVALSLAITDKGNLPNYPYTE